MRALAAIRVGLFLAVLMIPLVRMANTSAVLAHEQRARAPMPSLAAGRQFPEAFDAYFRDSFGDRDELIRWHNLLKFRAFGESPVPAVIVGRQGWLFYATPEDGLDIRNFSGRWPHQPSEVESWLDHQDARAREYAKAGARYLIAVVPDKQSIYPDLVPARFGPHAPGVLAEFVQRAASHPLLTVVDLTPVLQPERDRAQLYYKGDAHWNGQGAFLGAQAITDRLRQTLPGVGVLRQEDYVVRTAPAERGDLVRMLALGITVDDLSYTYERRTPGARQLRNDDFHKLWEQPGTGMPKAVIVSDSFGIAVAPILADAFSRTYFYIESLGGGWDPNLVPRERPDVVILVTVERYLPKLTER